MSSIVQVAGSSYSVPSEGDSGWATDVTNLLVQLATSTKVLQVTSSSFPLTQDLSFGSNYGLKIQYLKSQATNPASTGIVRLGNNESLKWRNAANSADLDLTVNASDALQFNGTSVLAAGLGSILNADISASAAIARSKLATLTASRAMVTDGSGTETASAVTATELGYVSGATSSIQTQITTNASNISAHTGATSAHGVSGAVVGTTDAQTLTSKTIVAANNTITTAASGNLTSTNLNAALAELQADIDTRETIANVYDIANTTSLADRAYADSADDNHRNTVDGIHGIAGNVVGTLDDQVLTNKDIDGGTASNSRRITIPKDTKTNLDGLTRKEGTLVFDTVAKQMYLDDGVDLVVLENGAATVAARAKDSSGQAISHGTTTIVNFNSVTFDTASGITTGASWKFTNNTGATAYFDISAQLNLVSATGGGSLVIYIYKNGSQYSTNYTFTGGAAPYAVNIVDIVELANTEYVDIRVLQNSGVARSLSANNSYVTIKKIK